MTHGPCSSLPTPEYIARAANRKRQQLRPKDPIDLNFELEDTYIPDGFFHSDVKVRDHRHLIFATDQQLQFLSQAKSWYIDGTFKLCRQPFTQLLMINVFVKYEDHAKQVPLLFVLMSGRKKKDYCKVFKAASGDPGVSPSCKADHRRLRESSVGSPEKSDTAGQTARMHVPLDAGSMEKGEMKFQ